MKKLFNVLTVILDVAILVLSVMSLVEGSREKGDAE